MGSRAASALLDVGTSSLLGQSRGARNHRARRARVRVARGCASSAIAMEQLARFVSKSFVDGAQCAQRSSAGVGIALSVAHLVGGDDHGSADGDVGLDGASSDLRVVLQSARWPLLFFFPFFSFVGFWLLVFGFWFRRGYCAARRQWHWPWTFTLSKSVSETQVLFALFFAEIRKAN